MGGVSNGLLTAVVIGVAMLFFMNSGTTKVVYICPDDKNQSSSIKSSTEAVGEVVDSPTPAPSLASPAVTVPQSLSAEEEQHRKRLRELNIQVFDEKAEDLDGRVVFVSYMSFMPFDDRAAPYTLSTFLYTRLWCLQNNVRYVYYVAPTEPPKKAENVNELPKDCEGSLVCRHGKVCHSLQCVGPNGCLLHPVWCKVKSMVTAVNRYKNAPYIVWLDSDAMVRYDDWTLDFAKWMDNMLATRGEDPDTKPFMGNQEQPSWWCNTIQKKNGTKGVFYRWCLNTGVQAIRPNKLGRSIVEHWWERSLDDYADNPLGYSFRKDWPWEQDRLLNIFNNASDPFYKHVQAVPSKNEFQHENWQYAEKKPGACLGGDPRWRCVINHFCFDLQMKHFWGNRTMFLVLNLLHSCATGNDGNIHFPPGTRTALPPAFPINVTYTPNDKWCKKEFKELDIPAVSVNNPDFVESTHADHVKLMLKAAKVLASPEVIFELP
eukprot:TRINITY_DN352_c6_g1_i1.p1 TRINITY_DN352_c6_g1~~TRINITY_DN352_c6_g1_i1.p1  ORF type:complete len:501 (+),score=85.07 TRINITY_DN352_c6_g1_i1:37-1503(+)